MEKLEKPPKILFEIKEYLSSMKIELFCGKKDGLILIVFKK